MSIDIALPESLIERARLAAASQSRSVAEQVEHWSRIGRVMEQNPDLPLALIREILTADQEYAISEYEPGTQSK
jgi:hypothetical protein